MKTLKFKTTINCSACLAKVTPVLNAQLNVKHWQVDTANADKILTIEGSDEVDEADLIHSLQKIGYKAEKI